MSVVVRVDNDTLSLSSTFAIDLECGNWLPLFFLATVRIFECRSRRRVVHQIKKSRRNESGDESPHSKMAKVELRRAACASG